MQISFSIVILSHQISLCVVAGKTITLSASCNTRNIVAHTATFYILTPSSAVALGQISKVLWCPLLFRSNRLVAMGGIIGKTVLCWVSAHTFEHDPILGLEVRF